MANEYAFAQYDKEIENKETKEKLGKYYYEMKVIDSVRLKEKYPIIYGYLQSIAPYNNIDHSMILLEKESMIRCVFFTDKNQYTIRFEPNKNYMCCALKARKKRPGELHSRGSDLPDGKISDDTWKKIINRIFAQEIKRLQIYK